MPSDIPNVFLDSNVWFSALYGSENCQKLLTAYQEGSIVVFVSQQVIEEIVRNIREKIPQALSVFQDFLTNNPPQIVPDPKHMSRQIKQLVSTEDQPIFTAAIAANVDYFVTGNSKDFSSQRLKKITGISILTPKQAIEAFGL